MLKYLTAGLSFPLILCRVPVSERVTLIREVDFRLVRFDFRLRDYFEYVCGNVPLMLRKDETVVYITKDEFKHIWSEWPVTLRSRFETKRVTIHARKNIFGGYLAAEVAKIETVKMTDDVYPLK